MIEGINNQALQNSSLSGITEYLKNRDQETSLITRIFRAIVKVFKSLFENWDRAKTLNAIITHRIGQGKNAQERHVLHVVFKHLFKQDSYLKSLGVNKERVLSRDELLGIAGLDPKKYAEKELEAIEIYNGFRPLKINIEKHREMLARELSTLFSKIVKGDRAFSQRLMLNDEFSKREQEGIDLLLKVASQEGKLQLTNKEKKKLKSFLKDANANISLNHRIENLLNEIPKDKFGGEKLKALLSIHTYSYKTKQIKPFIQSAQKLTRIVEALKKDAKAKIADDDKLNLGEMGLITSMLKLRGLLNFLDKASLIEDNSKLKAFFTAIKEAGAAITYVDRKFSQQTDYQSGDLMMYRGNDYSLFLNKKLEKMVDWQLSWLGSDYFHSAIINVPKKTVHISHVMDQSYEYNDAKAAQATYTDGFRLKFDGLIDDKVKPVLTRIAKTKNKQHQWNDLVGKKFREIIEKMHEDRTQFEKIKNSKWRRLMSGIMPHTRRNWIFQEIPKSFDRPMFEGKTDMICSEFAAKVLLSALVQLKKELSIEVNDYIAQEKEIPIESPIVVMPIPETQKLKRLNTALLMDFLKPHLTPVAKAPIIDQLFSTLK